MRTHFERQARMQMWIAGISIFLLAASAIVAIVRSIAVSYATVPDARALSGALSGQAAAPFGAEDAQRGRHLAPAVTARAASDRRNRARCRECGVITSIVPIERYGDVGGQDNADADAAGGVSGGADAAGGVKGKSYDVTVRFRDGSTTVFNEATHRSWRTGSRVMVIAGSGTPND